MKASEFARIKIIDDLDLNNLSVGDKFLYGSRVIAQKGSKKIGSQITYYLVTRKEGNGISYIPKIENLEEG